MTEIIVTLLVAAFGGLLGSAVGPSLSHFLDRKHREELRREQRQRELREMLEAMMRLARTIASDLTELQLAHLQNRDLNEVRLNQIRYVRELEARYPHFSWRPARIKESRLKEAAQILQNASSRAGLLIFDRLNSHCDLGAWDAAVAVARNEITEAIEAVDEILDDLNW